jgi:murein DD-endopeptidase MepM/ murein hydrolase activator NlpD
MNAPSQLSLTLASLCLAMALLMGWPAVVRVSRAALAPPSLEVAPQSVTQGGTVFVRIHAPAATAVALRQGTTRLEAARAADGRWEALLGIWAEEAPGTRTLTAEAVGADAPTSASTTVTVTKRTFPVQHLRMSSAQSSKYEAPSVQEEYRLIGEALHRDTARVWRGAFRRPTEGRVSTQYGVQRFRNGEKVNLHKGIDIAAPRGRLIVAANAGTVVLRRDFALHGRAVAIDHGGGVVGLYLHLNDFGVVDGQEVTAGQKIGRVGMTGASTGPHLHYALYVHGTAIDPLLWEKVPAGW